MATIRDEHDLHQLRADRRRRRLVGGHDRGAARAPDRLARQRLDAGVRRRPPRTRTRASRRPPRRTRRSRRSGRTRRACRSTRSCSAAAARRSCRSCARRSTGSTASSSARRWAPRRPRPRPARSASCASTRSRCCRSAATTWPTTSRTGSRSAERDGAKLPKIFYVNWFRKDEDGKFLWPGFGENSRVLEWVFRRCDGEAEAVETPIGLVPAAERAGHRRPRHRSGDDLEELLTVDEDALAAELQQIKEHLAKFGDDLPRRDPRAARGARGAPELSATAPAAAAGWPSRRAFHPQDV